MAQKERELLLQDLCARLPYGVMVKAQYKDGEGWKINDRKLLGLYTNGQIYLDCVYTNIENIKPYLRPMSSMTEEEKEELYHYYCKEIADNFNTLNLTWELRCCISNSFGTDWLNAHHFDYRNLIGKNLALEAPEGMYK